MRRRFRYVRQNGRRDGIDVPRNMNRWQSSGMYPVSLLGRAEIYVCVEMKVESRDVRYRFHPYFCFSAIAIAKYIKNCLTTKSRAVLQRAFAKHHRALFQI